MTRFVCHFVPAAALTLFAAAPATAGSDGPTNEDLKAITKKLDEIQRDLGEVKQLRRDVNDLSQRVSLLEQAVRPVPENRGRVSNYMPLAGDTATGTLRMRNTSPYAATVTVNGRAYRLEPNETRTETHQAGPLTYDVQADGFGVIRPAVSRNLPPNQTFQITITPPPPVSLELPLVPAVPVIVAGR